ncbi:MAG: AAA family ATPase [Bacteroidota bacterium]
MFPREIIEYLHSYILEKGFVYSKQVVANFYLSLKTKPFVILAGISGTGKSQLVRLFAEALGHGEHCHLIPVRPDWSDSSYLLGYRNHQGELVQGQLWKILEKAYHHPEVPHFVLLDEMNLARVEYYLSEVLSLMETRKFSYDRIKTESLQIHHDAWHIPDNIYFIGTVNVDEASQSFSRKVLDRANVIEMNDIHLDWPVLAETEIEVRDPIPNEFLRSRFIQAKDIPQEERSRYSHVLQMLNQINQILWQIELPIGYRIRDDILFYLCYRYEIRELISESEALDLQILQKILPRIYGHNRSTGEVLYGLIEYLSGKEFEGPRMDYKKVKEVLGDIRKQTYLYPHSLQKLLTMYKRFEENGYASFWL